MNNPNSPGTSGLAARLADIRVLAMVFPALLVLLLLVPLLQGWDLVPRMVESLLLVAEPAHAKEVQELRQSRAYEAMRVWQRNLQPLHTLFMGYWFVIIPVAFGIPSIWFKIRKPRLGDPLLDLIAVVGWVGTGVTVLGLGFSLLMWLQVLEQAIGVIKP